MNKQDVIDWKAHPITQKALQAIDEAMIDMRDSSLMDSSQTLDDFTKKAIYREGLVDGIKALTSWIEEAEFNAGDFNND